MTNDELLWDIKTALMYGWLDGHDLYACCNYCGNTAEHDIDLKRYVCDHAPTCLMTKYNPPTPEDYP